MSTNKMKRQAGLTLIEVMIASLILAAIVAMSGWLVWSSSNHVASADAALQLEMSAREFMTGLVKELHQSKMDSVQKVDTGTQVAGASVTKISVTSSTLGLLATPGTASTPSFYDPNSVPGPIVPHTSADFDGIRFRLPGRTMDLTMNNKNADGNATQTDPNKKNFDLVAFKASATSQTTSAWTYEVQYWWEIDNTQLANFPEGVAGSGANGTVRDGLDNNKNGVIDEGVIKKLETWFNIDGTLNRRTQSVVCRNVKSLSFYVPARNWGGTDWTGAVYAPSTPKQVIVTVVLEKADPKYPTNTSKTVTKTITTVIDVRN